MRKKLAHSYFSLDSKLKYTCLYNVVGYYIIIYYFLSLRNVNKTDLDRKIQMQYVERFRIAISYLVL